MSHVRSQIIASLQETLTGLPTTGANVHVARELPLQSADLPALLIHADSESIKTSETILTWPQRLERSIEVRVEALAEDTGALENDLATMLSEVESAIHTSVTSATCDGIILAALRLAAVEIERDTDGERTIGRLTMTWQGIYYTYSNAPDTAAT